MARSVAGNVDINIRANDQASATLNNVSKSVSRLPEQFAKSAGALRVLEGGLSGVSSEVAAATGKISGLGSIIATGGPFGLALAGLTLAVGAAVKVWQVYKDEQETIAAGQKAIIAAFERADAALRKEKEAVQKLADEFRFFGVETRQKQIELAEEENERHLITIDGIKREIELRDKQIGQGLAIERQAKKGGDKEKAAAVREMIDAQKAQIEETKKYLAIAENSMWTQREGLEILRSYQIAEQQTEEDEEKATAAKRRATEAESEKTEAERERLRGMQEYVAAEQKLAEAAAKRRAEDVKGRNAEKTSRADEAYRKQHKERLDAIRKQIQLEEELEQIGIRAAEALGQAWGNTVGQLVAGEITAGQAGKRMAIDVARAGIQAAIAVGMAKAVAAYSEFPFIGIAMGLAAAGALSEVILGYLGKLPTAEQGGIFRAPRAGGPGLMVGHDMERTLTARQTSLFERMVTALERNPESSGVSQVIHADFRSMVPRTSAETARGVRDLNKQIRRAQKRGH